jgi:hypothetical protein
MISKYFKELDKEAKGRYLVKIAYITMIDPYDFRDAIKFCSHLNIIYKHFLKVTEAVLLEMPNL